MASSSKNQFSSALTLNQKPGDRSITSQPKRQELNTGGSEEVTKKRDRTGEDDQETEAPSIKRQPTAGDANDQEEARVPNSILVMSSEYAKLDAMATAMDKIKTNEGHFQDAMKRLFENTIKQKLDAAFDGEGCHRRVSIVPVFTKSEYKSFLWAHQFSAYKWACAIRPVLYEDTGFSLERGSPADDEMLPIIWRTVLNVQGGLIDDWMRKYKADGSHKVKKDKHGAKYLKVKVENVQKGPNVEKEDEVSEQQTTRAETEPLLIPSSIWD